MPNGGRLTIETKNVTLDDEYCCIHPGAEPGECVLLSVTDTGHGMSKEVQGHISEPFFTTKGPNEGTGLAPAMVYGIVKSHHGHTNCYTEPGTGTTIRIYLPAIVTVRESETDVPEASPPPPVPSDSPGGRRGARERSCRNDAHRIRVQGVDCR